MNKRNNLLTYFIILFSFILSIAVSNYNLKNYDKIVSKSDIRYHQMIKTDALRYLGHGAEIKKQLDEGVSFFSTGRENYTKYLPPRLAALYYYVFDINLFNNFEERIVNIGIHHNYLYIQCFIYFLSILFLYFSIREKFDEKIIFFIIVFLCLEPTIFQYHGTFWSESVFFSIQIILLSLILSQRKNYYTFFLIGFVIGVLSLQKQLAIFYIVPCIIFFLFSLKEKKKSSFFLIFIGYMIIQMFIGYNNLSRSGKFYVMTSDTKLDLHRDLVVKVISKEMNLSMQEFNIHEGKASKQWLEKENIEYDENYEMLFIRQGFMDYRYSIKNESDKVLFDNFIRKRTFNYIFDNILPFTRFIIKSSIHTVLLNPFHIYSDHNFESGEYYYTTKIHNKLVPVRILYTFIIYLICLIGLVEILRKKNFELLLILTLSIIYFYGLVNWHGNTRYFVPNLIYISFFFGFGTKKTLQKLFKKKFIF